MLNRVRWKIKQLCPKGSMACVGGKKNRNFLTLDQVISDSEFPMRSVTPAVWSTSAVPSNLVSHNDNPL